ncbi:MAG: ATP-dependent DNA helicase RecG [Rhodocyclaceae bacterium]|nr:ATP-dependent DNA helicase RecG [Rhodocyclaceae bacterium]
MASAGRKAAGRPGPVAFPGVGPALAEKLHRLGLRRLHDLVLHLPLRYEDETRITPLAEALPGVAAQFEVEVVDCEIAYRPRRQLVARVRDASDPLACLVLRFLNFYPSQQKQLQPGRRLRVFGEVRNGFLGPELVHPRTRVVEAGDALPPALTPVYPTTAGLAQSVLRRLVARALADADLGDTLPEALLASLGLPDFGTAIRALHNPPPGLDADALDERLAPAWHRIRFDELLAQQLSLRRAYEARRRHSAPALGNGAELTGRLLRTLPFPLTGAQCRAWEEIAADLAAPHPMQRLLQGDVGSGKTVVAALAMLRAAENGSQAAMMAPTEILAEQHWRKLDAWLRPLGIEVAWLSGSRSKADRKAAREALAEGRTMLAVGTHALIEAEVAFPKLGLAIIDEQHRFGVRQRLALKRKGTGHMEPHQLTMSATPIPRTLAMSHYADLDVSVLDELPPGRRPVLTKLVAENRRDEVLARVRDACRAGRQAYWVCPLIEESETLELKTAQETFDRLTTELPDLAVGLVHGRLKPDEKAAVMDRFAGGRTDLLVATTVIEVGVDVPNAALMVIEHAERFGLAQLHQLRGRVGRGTAESACILLYAAPLSATARERLKIIYENSDGFEIARLDLRMRGPGEFIGSRQSGVPLLRFADLEDAGLVESARREAERMLREAPAACDAHLGRWLSGREDLLKA